MVNSSRAFIFTLDAAIAFIVILSLVSFWFAFAQSSTTSVHIVHSLHEQALDAAAVSFYSNASNSETLSPTAIAGSCTTRFTYAYQQTPPLVKQTFCAVIQ